MTADKDGDDSVFEQNLHDADIVISQPFWPAYMTAERIAKAPNLQMCITAGIGYVHGRIPFIHGPLSESESSPAIVDPHVPCSCPRLTPPLLPHNTPLPIPPSPPFPRPLVFPSSDHVDLEAACANNVSVTEVTFCNSISVAEHVVMMILGLVRNYIPSYKVICDGGWNIADCVERSYDVEGMNIGTVAAGRIGLAVLRRMHPFDTKLHYCDRHRLPESVEKELNLTHWSDVREMVKEMDVVTINCPLHPETEHLFDAELIGTMKRGAYIVNTARGKICNRDDIAAALESGQLAGYAGDVWFPQPPPKDHPWRTMPHHMMTPHISGTSLSAQTRYCAGVKEILECHFEGRDQRNEYLIAENGKLAGVGAHSYSEGNATGGTDESRAFKDGGGNTK